MPPTSPPPTFTRLRRDLVTVAGPEAISFLQGQLSQDVAGLPIEGATWSFLLQPQGKVDAWFRVQRTAEDAVVIDVDPGWGEAVVTRLNRFKLRTKAEITLAADQPAVAVRGALVEGGLPCGWPGTIGTDHLGVADPAHLDGLPADAVELEAAGYEVLRIAAGVPAMGSELTEATIPAEAGQWVIDASVSFTKGCYTGQELVARIDSRGGNVPRHLRGFATAADAPPVAAELTVEGEVVGTVTSVATAADGTTVGLAYVKRSVEPPAAARAGDAAVEVLALPLHR